MPGIRVLLEDHQICAKNAIQDFLPSCQSTVLASILTFTRIGSGTLTWQTPEDLAAGERRMYEQTNKCVLGLLVDILEQSRQRQKVIVVYPDEVAWLPYSHELFSKCLIGLEVSLPVRLFRRDLSRNVLPEEVVEKWPKC